MMLARRGSVMKISLVTCYIGAVFGWLILSMVKGNVERAAWFDPVFIVFSLIGLGVITLALDSIMLIVVRGDTLQVIGIFRRSKLRRDSCRFVVRRIGRLRSASHAVLLTDGQQHRQVGHYWMWGDLLATRAVARLEKSLLED